MIISFKHFNTNTGLLAVLEKISAEIENTGLDKQTALVKIELCPTPKDARTTEANYPLFNQVECDEYICSRPESNSCCSASLRQARCEDANRDCPDVGLDNSQTF